MPLSSYDFIRRKRFGEETRTVDIKAFVKGYVEGNVADYQMSAWLMAVSINGLGEEELFAYTEALMESGERFDLSGIPGFKVDKHSTGGVGDKVSLVLAPLAAACGVAVPMVSGRGLGHTGGTLDKLASIPGFRTDLTLDEFKRFLGKTGVAMMGQTSRLCPADGKIYALRDVTATVESVPLIAASISSKKIAEGADGLVLDVKVGSGAFMTDEQQAVNLAQKIISITAGFKVKTTAILSDMNQPLGQAVGNALEVAEAIDCLKGRGPKDLRELVLELAAEMLTLTRVRDKTAGRDKLTEEHRKEAESVLDSGRALDKFRELLEMQGGDPRVADDALLLPRAELRIPVVARDAGIIQSMDTYRIGMLAVELGAGRRKKEDAIDPGVGFEIERKIGDEVRSGDEVASVHASDENLGLRIAHDLPGCFVVGSEPISISPLVIRRIT